MFFSHSALGEIDTAQNVKKKVEIFSFFLIPRFLAADSVVSNLYRGVKVEDFYLWDSIERLRGFTQSLGLNGKPILNFQNALLPKYHLSNLKDYAVLDYQSHRKHSIHLLPFLNTRTPFFDIQFLQGAGEMQQLKVLASQNINPLLNVTITYDRLSAIGFYPNSKVDHYSLGVTTNFHSLRKKLFLLAALEFDQFFDQISGGSLQRGIDAFQNSFGRAALPYLSSAGYFQRYRSSFLSFFYLLPSKSRQKSKIIFSSTLKVEDQLHQYQDKNTYPDSLPLVQPAFPYGQIYNSNVSVDNFTEFSSIFFQNFATWIYRLNIHQVLESQLIVEQQLVDISSLGSNYSQLKQNVHTIRSQSFYRSQRLLISAHVFWSISKLLPSLGQYEAKGVFQPWLNNYLYEDSILEIRKGKVVATPKKYEGMYAPLELELYWRQGEQNPSLQSMFWQSNTFLGNSSLRNEGISQLKLTALFKKKPVVRKGFLHLQDIYSISFFNTQIYNPIFYNASAEAVQLSGEIYQWLGMEVALRQRWDVCYAEMQFNFQKSISQGRRLLTRYAKSLPTYFGKLSFYYFNKIAKRPITLKVGLDVYFFTSFQALQWEPSLRILYPQQDEFIKGYTRWDAYISAQIRTAHVFFKLAHLNEGLADVGYYTVPFYPMLGRNFCFGVQWQLFD
ncbi:MAG: putative porin [Bacteroidia bacterium]|nr:putative porin [Bacteroidia bacterium]MDW8158552.1 putative porin [Bacteroidia bacterium]